jgi:hypothetical protein
MFLFSQIWLKGLWMIATHVTSHNWWKKKVKKSAEDIKTWPENLNVSQTIFMERNFPPNPWGFWLAEYVLPIYFIPASISVHRTLLASLCHRLAGTLATLFTPVSFSS